MEQLISQEYSQYEMNDAQYSRKSMAFLAPRPKTINSTGLSTTFLEELLAKHLYETGVLDLRQITKRIALSGPVVEEILVHMRGEAYVEVREPSESSVGLRYALTERGRAFAAESLLRSGYVGPAPVSIDHYNRVIRSQSVHQQNITRKNMHDLFSDIVIDERLLDQLGMALNSGRAIFVYGQPGTGKTYIGERLARLLGDPVLIPNAVVIDDTPIQVFDPLVHHPLSGNNESNDVLLDEGFDPRFNICMRPVVISGGELTADMLETRHDDNARLHYAPLHMKANNGIYLLDDLGRQRVSPKELLNRWIVPLENRKDFLNLSTGKRFPVAFDVVLIFSTNMNPYDLADQAFLRRIGHKIHFGPLNHEQYSTIWMQLCEEKGVIFDAAAFDYLVNELHKKNNVPMLACHPRDLLDLTVEESKYYGQKPRLTYELLNNAWNNYFVTLEDEVGYQE